MWSDIWPLVLLAFMGGVVGYAIAVYERINREFNDMRIAALKHRNKAEKDVAAGSKISNETNPVRMPKSSRNTDWSEVSVGLQKAVDARRARGEEV